MTDARRATRLGALVLLVAAVLGCADTRGPEDPVAALERLQTAVAASDGEAVYALYDRESRGYYTDLVREWRAAVEGGSPLDEVVPAALEWSRDDLLEGSAEDVTARMLGRHSSFAGLREWFRDATVGDVVREDEDQARLTLVGPDGSRRDIWFVREPTGWAYDHYRSRW